MMRSMAKVAALLTIMGCLLNPARADELTGRAGPFQLKVAVDPDPPTAGPNSVTVTVTDRQGQSIDNAEVKLAATRRGGDEQSASTATANGDGTYRGTVTLEPRGKWDLRIDLSAGSQTGRTSFGLLTGNPVHQLNAGRVRTFWTWVGIMLIAPVLVLAIPGGETWHRRRGLVSAVLLLLAGYFVAKHAVQTFRRPGAMNVVEAQAMDMTLMVPPVGIVPVAVEQLEPTTFRGGVTYSGSVVPYSEQEVKPRVVGWITDMPVYPGDVVKPGQVLAQLDTAELSAREQQAMMAQVAAREMAGASRSEALMANAALQQALSQQQATTQRVTETESDVAGARAALDRAKSDLETRQAGLEEARSQLTAAQAAQRTAQSMVTESQAGVQLAEAQHTGGGGAVRQAEQELAGARSGLTEARSNVDAAQAGLEHAQAELDVAKAALPQAQAQVKSARAEVDYWGTELGRMTKLLADGAVSQEEYDREKSQREQAQARLETANAGVTSVEGKIAAGQAGVRSATAQLAAARQRQAGAEAMVKAAQAKLDQAGSALDARAAQVSQSSAGEQSRQAMAEEAQSMVAMRQAQVARAQAEVKGAEAAVRQAEQALQGKRSASAQAKSNVARARAMVDGARANATAAAQRASSAGSQAASQAAAASAESTIKDYTTIRSHLAGVVTARPTAPPTLVGPGTVLLKIAEISRVRLQASVAIVDAARIKVGYPIEVTAQKDPTRRLQAQVTAVFPASDPDSRTTVIEAVVVNPDRFYLPGDYLTMRIGLGAPQHEALTVPQSAVVETTADAGAIFGDTVPAVWTVLGSSGPTKTDYYCTMHPEVVQDHPGDCPKCNMALVPRELAGGPAKTEYYCTMHPEVVQDHPGKCPKCNMDLVPREAAGGAGVAHLVHVKLGIRDGDRVEVTDGLHPGDQVIYRGQLRLKEGDRVSPTATVDVSPPAVGSVTHEGHDDSGGGGDTQRMPGMDH